jgi:RNA-directed DNA polymerase
MRTRFPQKPHPSLKLEVTFCVRGVISPLLANLYMNRFLKYWRITGQDEILQAQVVNYADDFVILSRRCAAEALNWTRNVMTRIGLTLNETKTSIKKARTERFDFLGYTFGPHRFRKTGRLYLGASPSKKSVSRLRLKVGDLLKPGNVEPWPDVRDHLNRILRGWSNYFSYGITIMANRAVDNYVYERVRNFLRRRHKVQSRGGTQYSGATAFGKLGVLRLCAQYVGRTPEG